MPNFQLNDDPFDARDTFDTGSGEAYLYRLSALEDEGYKLDHLPVSIRVLLEAMLRECDGTLITEDNVRRFAQYDPSAPAEEEIPFVPSRVLLQDFTGVPAVVDLAALRSAMDRLGGDPNEINPQVPVHLIIDHSVQVDHFGTTEAIKLNSEIEFKRNRERYEFLRWGSEAFENFSVVPPASGICHQVNLEYVARGVWTRPTNTGIDLAYPDSLVGTDSHTTMINGLGVLGWGVGGIEAEAAMLGQPIYMLMPEVIGVNMTGELAEGATATDLVLTVTEMLRDYGVVGRFVEFFGPGMQTLTVPDRATIANMSPEYGATMGFFPIDNEALNYMRRTNRSEEQVQLVERYCKEQGLFHTPDTPAPECLDVLELDLSSITPSVAGPKRPQDRITVPELPYEFNESLTREAGPVGFGLDEDTLDSTGAYDDGEHQLDLTHGDTVIAAITSCTNTSNPSVMLGAGLIAKKAVEKGLTVPPYVKTSLAPGSKVVTDYLVEGNLMPYLDQLGFNTVGYGCTTCIGNSGPLPEPVENAIKDGNLIVSGVLSGNRNFEGRIHSLVQANYLASPPLVVAYALAGTVDIDLTNDPIGTDNAGEPVYLEDIWPSSDEIKALVDTVVKPEFYKEEYEGIEESNETWNNISIPEGSVYDWDDESTYIQEPPFFMDLTPEVPPITSVEGARVLVKAGDSTTTDHISPAGAIPEEYPAGEYLKERGVKPYEFNSYGARRGNHEVMMRGTFANIRIKNELVRDEDGNVQEGGVTRNFLNDGEITTVFDAAMDYIDNDVPLVVLGGKDYGMGSSRDWAAKGTILLGVDAVIVESYERIHRSNLIGMGVLPLQYKDGDTAESLGLDGTETFDIPLNDDLEAGQDVEVIATKEDGTEVRFTAVNRCDTPIEVEYYRHGGILHYVLRDYLSNAPVAA
ncbi:aconitate hydratase AcnA [Longimonas halophila]|uniref:Aconitate hydratase n=1 Tax=Longimonas halophila TaxID=1469170 RepID=A0A2H3NX40_9BACT|nr:aconitate hydratase AcnA [Longimonas halophila]PEN09504.1 aconitate hydratase AcnA [Longimonas halophila]